MCISLECIYSGYLCYYTFTFARNGQEDHNWNSRLCIQYAYSIGVQIYNVLSCLECTRKAMYISGNTEALSCDHYCSGRATVIACSKCVFVALVIQHAKRMRPIILSRLACPAVSHFSTLSRKRHDFRKKRKHDGTSNVYFDFLYNVCLKHFSFWEEFSVRS